MQLKEPANGTVTAPLQKYYWPEDGERSGVSSNGFGANPLPVIWNALESVAEDRSAPEAVRFVWDDPDALKQGVTYDLTISRFPDFRDARVVRDILDTSVEVLHLHIATRYFWRVAARRGGREIRHSATWSFATHEATPRWIAVPGITNVRDMGGWPLPNGRRVRQGLIYRSSEMNSHVVIAEEGKRVLLEDLGIRTDLDLRGAPEDARPVLDPSRVEWINVPVQPYGAIGDPRFFNAFRRVFGILSDPRKYPILFHCWGGADRAGTVAFLLSALLGKDRPSLIRDYELTSLSVWGPRSWQSPEFRALLGALDAFDDGSGDIHRQVENYLLSIGVRRTEIDTLRLQMIADDTFV